MVQEKQRKNIVSDDQTLQLFLQQQSKDLVLV